MRMRWIRLGHVFCPNGESPWMRTHATNPVAEPRPDGTVRVYFGSRDDANRTSIGTVDVELGEAVRLLAVSAEPVLAPGPLGGFDDSGTSMGCLISAHGIRRLYYLGWNLGVTVPWRNSIGLATAPFGRDQFTRVSPVPVLDRNRHDPFSLSYPWVLRDGARWLMWYGSNRRGGESVEAMDHVIKRAESDDGEVWRTTVDAALQPGPGEIALARPCVVRDADRWRMWFSCRGRASYRIGYAESPDGVHWTRMDPDCCVDPSDAPWENEAVSYPCVFDHAGRRYMLYNGNGYGRTGFGLAVLDWS